MAMKEIGQGYNGFCIGKWDLGGGTYSQINCLILQLDKIKHNTKKET